MNDDFDEIEYLQEIQDSDDIGEIQANEIVVYSRDWTIGTFYDQIEQGNIDLNPGFQRRNAWDDPKRGKLIESIIKGYPVPEIVLAENTNNRGSFIVIDGKQRLLTMAGFINHERYKYWQSPMVRNLKIGNTVSNYTYTDISRDPALRRAFENASLRCTIITNYKSDDVLYDIFYRLNSGSSPLSSQELRQALNKGPYSDYLVQITNDDSVLRKVMNLKSADRRLRDIEVILRIMSFLRYAKDYHGNLRLFLDNTMKQFNQEYAQNQEGIHKLYKVIIDTIDILKNVFGDYCSVGRRFKNGEFESRFNRVILEVQIYYFSQTPETFFSKESNATFVDLFKKLCDNDASFRASVEGSTKNMENYAVRYKKFQDIFNQAYHCNLNINPYLDVSIH